MRATLIFQKLLKVALAMLENDNCGELPEEALIHSLVSGGLLEQPQDLEAFYTDCKQAIETTLGVTHLFTRPMHIEFVQREKFVPGDRGEEGHYAPDNQFIFSWIT